MRFWLHAFVTALIAIHARVSAQRSDFPNANFRKADSIAAQYDGHSLADRKLLAAKLTCNLNSDEEKFRAIYKWICNNIDYDYELHQENQKKRIKHTAQTHPGYREWQRKFMQRVVSTLLRHHRTVCTGYASLLQELALNAGIQCVMVNGYGRTTQANVRTTSYVNHTWNATRLGGKWYLSDVTWSSGAYDLRQEGYVRKFEECYFLADPNVFIRNHYAVNEPPELTKNNTISLNDFANRPIFYVNAIRLGITTCTPNALDLTMYKGTVQSFEFNADSSRIKSAAIKVNGVLHRKVLTFQPNGVIQLQQHFNSKGKYTIHLMINDEPTITYQVTVR